MTELGPALRIISRGTLRTLGLFGQMVLVLAALFIGSWADSVLPALAVLAIFGALLVAAARYGGGLLQAPALTVLVGLGIYGLRLLPPSFLPVGAHRDLLDFGAGAGLALGVFGVFAALRAARKRSIA